MDDLAREIVTVARAVIAGQIGIIEGSIKLNNLRHKVSSEGIDADFLMFVVIESDTDHLPIGKVRDHWSPKALEKVDPEIREIEEFYRSNAIEACWELIRRFDKSGV